MNHVVECNEVSRVYDQESVPVTALDGVDLTISEENSSPLSVLPAQANRPCSTS